jgi:Spy/CpxP family protein refolding chaperone
VLRIVSSAVCPLPAQQAAGSKKRCKDGSGTAVQKGDEETKAVSRHGFCAQENVGQCLLELEVKMKKTLLFVATALFAFAAMTPSLGLGSFTAAATPMAVAGDPQTPPSPPQGVSPADPTMKMPEMEHECCGCCGCCRGGMRGPHIEREKGRFGRPALGPDDEGIGERGDGMGKPYRSMMHQKATRQRQMDRSAMREGMAPCGEMMGREGMAARRADMRDRQGWGPGHGIAAERMLHQAKDLDLSDEQIDRLRTLAFETQKELVDLHAEIEKGQLEIRNQLQSGSDDLGQIRTHLETVSKARAGIQEARIANLFEARKVLTEKQKKLITEKFPRFGMILE